MSAFVAGDPRLSTAATVFCGVFVQALPFLVLGVVVSGLIAAFVSAERLRGGCRTGPRGRRGRRSRRGRAARLRMRIGAGGQAIVRPGMSGAAALTFMLSAPAINPVVLVATAVAFPGQPAMVLARCVASLITAVTMGLLWPRWGRDEWVTRDCRRRPPTGPPAGASSPKPPATTSFRPRPTWWSAPPPRRRCECLLPAWVFEHLAGNLVVGVVTMALLAVVLALCSEADAFVAASLTMLPLVPRLVFLVVGPAFDVKLAAMQAGMFGRPFAVRFGPATFVVATVIATAVGLALLGGGT